METIEIFQATCFFGFGQELKDDGHKSQINSSLTGSSTVLSTENNYQAKSNKKMIEDNSMKTNVIPFKRSNSKILYNTAVILDLHNNSVTYGLR